MQRSNCKRLVAITLLTCSNFAYAAGSDDKFEQILSLNLENTDTLVGATMEGRQTLKPEEIENTKNNTEKLTTLTETYLMQFTSNASANCKEAISNFREGPYAALKRGVSEDSYLQNFLESGALDDTSELSEELTAIAFDRCAS